MDGGFLLDLCFSHSDCMFRFLDTEKYVTKQSARGLQVRLQIADYRFDQAPKIQLATVVLL